MKSAEKVSVSELIKKENLKNLTPEIDTDQIYMTIPDVNRPALQLAGFFAQFDSERVQIIGNVETAYLMRMERPERRARYNVHGVLVDVYGEGVLIMGDSGIGKSEAALELIKRGHRLVSDDVVELRKVSDESLVGTAPDITKHFIELRGIGIIDVKQMFGVESVKDTQTLNMVINLAEWSKEKDYDRLGLKDNYIEFLGNNIISYDIPIRPGRNVAIIVECAAINNRAKKMGYNAAQVLYERVTANMKKQEAEDF